MSEVVLTKRQLELICLLSQGWTRKAIAERLHIAAATVGFHVQALLRLTHTSNCTALIALTVSQGVLSQNGWPLELTGVTSIEVP